MDACLDGADFTDADLYWCIAFGASFRAATLVRASLLGADLKEVNFAGTDLTDADLGTDNVGSATQLQGANLSDARLARTHLTGAHYDRLTRFPDGFDPQAAGMILVDTAA